MVISGAQHRVRCLFPWWLAVISTVNFKRVVSTTRVLSLPFSITLSKSFDGPASSTADNLDEIAKLITCRILQKVVSDLGEIQQGFIKCKYIEWLLRIFVQKDIWEIKISGYPKGQETFARVSGYCEQTNVHSPQLTVEESLIFSAWLHLSPEINTKTKTEFVNQVLEIIELDNIKDALVGIPGVTDLSVEQRRTIVCTTHQPSIDIFEAFDEAIPRVLKFRDNYNPATWILELSSPSSEVELGVEFSQIYTDSALYEHSKALVRGLSTPPPGSKDLHFPTCFTQSGPRKGYIPSNIYGVFYVSVIFVGINNCSTAIHRIATERNVMYQEKFAGMYSPWAFSFAQVTVKLPYLCLQAIMYVIITYPMIGFYWPAYKVFWVFCLSCNATCGIDTDSHGCFYSIFIFSTLFNLFPGFLIPELQIPKWWVWLYYLIPTSWTLNSLIT
ncbi:hypothetical protein Patl1_24666 [Pistacia atlantica]|uniref:Uncharacterized protein n=1 Tax=Pistacia atlantica TaxID=434234 RepID=A0ACC0ZY34_9ROSI|nr:hypothetical protein Patl1_24666 [Pistacia atlantica]